MTNRKNAIPRHRAQRHQATTPTKSPSGQILAVANYQTDSEMSVKKNFQLMRTCGSPRIAAKLHCRGLNFPHDERGAAASNRAMNPIHGSDS
jgi:hypothetical protein